jgi:POT family proton-dependent oligopeptide transporter
MIKNTDYTDYFMYAIGPLAILYFLYETLKREEASRKKLIAAFIFILFYRFLGILRTKWWFSALCKDNLRNNLLFFEINLILLTIHQTHFFIIFSNSGVLMALAKKK